MLIKAQRSLYSSLCQKTSSNFMRGFYSLTAASDTGLFGLPELTSPSHFRKFKNDALMKCKKLVSEFGSLDLGVRTLRTLDQISDTLCRVADVAEVCQHVHPDENWRNAAQETYTEITQYMEVLNNDMTIYNPLNRLCANTEIMKNLTSEQQRCALMFKKDMELRGGVRFTHKERQETERLHQLIYNLELQFRRNLEEQEDQFVEIYASMSLIPASVRHLVQPTASRNSFMVPMESGVVTSLLTWCHDGEIREKIYRAKYGDKISRSNLDLLFEITKARQLLANTQGYPSFAHYNLDDSLAETPESVMSFLDSLSSSTLPLVEKEMDLIRRQKLEREGNENLNHWDARYYFELAKDTLHIRDEDCYTYFSLDNCLKGLNLVTESLYKCSIYDRSLQPGESWWTPTNDKLRIRRLEIVDNITNELVGTIYLDVFHRSHKSDTATFVITCGRLLTESEGNQKPGDYQKPRCAVVCCFNPHLASDKTPLLDFSDVQTLFHEFGHALHHTLSKTEFQHFAGTRHVLDFVETPSIFMENYTLCEKVLPLFALRHQSQTPISQDLMQNLRRSKQSFRGMLLSRSILQSAVALQLFQPTPQFLKSQTNPIPTLIQTLEKKYTPYQISVDGTSWASSFIHFLHYGASYYAYLYCRAFSAAIWDKFFSNNPLSSEGGAILRQHFLMPGGSRPPLEIFRSILGPTTTNVPSTQWFK